jgi:hypothetical protein
MQIVQSDNYFDPLPNEIRLNLLGRLGPQELLVMRAVSREWHTLVVCHIQEKRRGSKLDVAQRAISLLKVDHSPIPGYGSIPQALREREKTLQQEKFWVADDKYFLDLLVLKVIPCALFLTAGLQFFFRNSPFPFVRWLLAVELSLEGIGMGYRSYLIFWERQYEAALRMVHRDEQLLTDLKPGSEARSKFTPLPITKYKRYREAAFWPERVLNQHSRLSSLLRDYRQFQKPPWMRQQPHSPGDRDPGILLREVRPQTIYPNFFFHLAWWRFDREEGTVTTAEVFGTVYNYQLTQAGMITRLAAGSEPFDPDNDDHRKRMVRGLVQSLEGLS